MAGAGRSLEKEAFWRLVLEEHQASGLLVRAFCQQESLSEPSFYAWRKKLRKRDQKADVAQEPRLLPVQVVEGDPRASKPSSRTSEKPWRTTLEVVTPCGHTLRLERDVDPQRLGQLLSAIATAKTSMVAPTSSPDNASC